MMARMLTLASLFALLGVLVYKIDHPLGYAATALAAVGGCVFTYRKAKRSVGSDGFAGDLPPHVRRQLEGKK